MAFLGWAARRPKGKGARDKPGPRRGIFREGAPPNHDAGSGTTHPKEPMMRFYNQPHRFYCGTRRHARRSVKARRARPTP
jgi:hypothetical protein